MSFTKGVSTGYESNGFFVVHRHSSERFADVLSGSKCTRITVRSLGINIDQSHLNSLKRIIEFPITFVALVSKPFGLRSPVNILFRLPGIFASTSKSESLKTH